MFAQELYLYLLDMVLFQHHLWYYYNEVVINCNLKNLYRTDFR